MKTITIHVSEETYTAFQDRYAERHLLNGTSVFDHAPADAGAVIRPLERDDDPLEEIGWSGSIHTSSWRSRPGSEHPGLVQPLAEVDEGMRRVRELTGVSRLDESWRWCSSS